MTRRQRIVPTLCLAVAACGPAAMHPYDQDAAPAIDAGPNTTDARPPQGHGQFGEPCVGSIDCASDVCFAVSDDRSVCSKDCSDSTDCAMGWTCESTFGDELEALVCACSASPDLCDGVDNDCNATTPDGTDEAGLHEPCGGTVAESCLTKAWECRSGVLACVEITDTCEPWVVRWGDISAQGSFDQAFDLAVDDRDDSIVVTGIFAFETDLGPNDASDIRASGGGVDVYVSKYNADGTYAWGRTWGGISDTDWYNEWASCVDVGPDGSVLVSGWFASKTDFDPGPGIDGKTPEHDQEVFVTKLDSDGSYVWNRTFPAFHAWRLAVADDGAVFVVGDFFGTVDFDPGPGVASHTAGGVFDVFVTKFDSDGNHVWTRTWGGADVSTAYGVAVAPDGTVLVAGSFLGTADFNPGDAVDERTSAGDEDAFAVALDPDGEYLWARTWGGAERDFALAVASDSAGAAIVKGEFLDSVDFDPGPGTDAHDGSMFASKLGATGDFQWARTWTLFGGSFYYEAGLAVASDDSVLLAGSYGFIDTDFDPGPDSDLRASPGNGAFITRVDTDGNYLSTATWPISAPSELRGADVGVAADGTTYLTGIYLGDVDPWTGEAITPPSMGTNSDDYLMRVAAP